MKIYLFILLMLIDLIKVSAQEIEVAPKINQIQLDKVRSKYIQYQQQKRSIKLIIDVKSVLIDIIPRLVLDNREIRYKWDKYYGKSINVYKHLVLYDSINNRINSNLKNSNFDTSFTLKNNIDGGGDLVNVEYTNLVCIDTFKYSFNFVDDQYKADFILSSFKESTENKKLIYIWFNKNTYESKLLHVEAKLPWDVDCYTTKILKEKHFAH